MMYWPNGQRILAGPAGRGGRRAALRRVPQQLPLRSRLLPPALRAGGDARPAVAAPRGGRAQRGRRADHPARGLPRQPESRARAHAGCDGAAAAEAAVAAGTTRPARHPRALPISATCCPARRRAGRCTSPSCPTARTCWPPPRGPAAWTPTVLPMQDARDLELGRRHTSSRECFPMICTTGSFLKKLEEPGVDPGRVSFFMPRHTGPCRFGQYHKLQRIILERLGCGDAEIVSPSNRTSYADFSPGTAVPVCWCGRRSWPSTCSARMRQEHRPLERAEGAAETVYRRALAELVGAIERGGREIDGRARGRGRRLRGDALGRRAPTPRGGRGRARSSCATTRTAAGSWCAGSRRWDSRRSWRRCASGSRPRRSATGGRAPGAASRSAS